MHMGLSKKDNDTSIELLIKQLFLSNQEEENNKCCSQK